jgi:hypothetical protein
MSPHVQLLELDLDINDPEFAALAATLLRLMQQPARPCLAP